MELIYMLSEKNRENKLRRQLYRQYGYQLCKSRKRKPCPGDWGGYSIICDGAVVAGAELDLSLDDVEQFIKDCHEEGPEA